MKDSRSEKTIERLLELSISIEYKAADLYKKLSKLFSHVPSIHKFWMKMHDDEIQHVVTLQNVRNLLSLEQRISQTTDEMWEKVMISQRMLSTDLIGSINNLDDAYDLAYDIEFSEVNGIFKFLASELISFDRHEEFIVAIIAKHQRKILDFSSNYGDRDWRKTIKSQRVE